VAPVAPPLRAVKTRAARRITRAPAHAPKPAAPKVAAAPKAAAASKAATPKVVAAAKLAAPKVPTPAVATAKVAAPKTSAAKPAVPKVRPAAARAANGSATAAPAALKEFRISFITELVLEAQTISAAIQKAEVLGAVDIRSIARVP
jgi:hypothetical protein